MYFTWNLGASPLSTCTHLDNVFSSAQLFSNRDLQCSWGSPTPFTTIPHTDHLGTLLTFSSASTSLLIKGYGTYNNHHWDPDFQFFKKYFCFFL